MTDEGLMAKVLEHYEFDLTRVSPVGWRPVKCRFHEDRQASASVNLNLGGFRCHACGVSGDALKLLMEREGIGYRDACALAESLLGESLRGVRKPASRARPRPVSRWRDKLFS